MIPPSELALLIQSTIYFTVVSDTDGFKWECNQANFFQDACLTLNFTNNQILNAQNYVRCAQGNIKPFVVPNGEGSCGTSRTDTTIKDIDVTAQADCSSSSNCYPAYTTDKSVQSFYCVCDLSSNASPTQPFTLTVDTDECVKQFAYTVVALLVLLLCWLARVLLQGVWNYRRFYIQLQQTATSNGAVTPEHMATTWESLENPWRQPLKIPFGIYDILTAMGLCAIMFVLAVNPYHFCDQPKLYSCVALAALSLVNVITFIPYVIILKCIQFRVTGKNAQSPTAGQQHS